MYNIIYVSVHYQHISPINTSISESPLQYYLKNKTMAKPILLYTSLCFLVLFINGCLAHRQWQKQQEFNQCQLDSLDALEPNNRIEAEAGVIESWDPNDDQFQCVGVAVVRRTIEPNGLLLPQYASAPQLIYIERGILSYTEFSSVQVQNCII